MAGKEKIGKKAENNIEMTHAQLMASNGKPEAEFKCRRWTHEILH